MVDHWYACPKCGGKCHGPWWDEILDRLRYRCACGYVMWKPTQDLEGATPCNCFDADVPSKQPGFRKDGP